MAIGFSIIRISGNFWRMVWLSVARVGKSACWGLLEQEKLYYKYYCTIPYTSIKNVLIHYIYSIDD